jgi:hypothetical protein
MGLGRNKAPMLRNRSTGGLTEFGAAVFLPAVLLFVALCWAVIFLNGIYLRLKAIAR